MAFKSDSIPTNFSSIIISIASPDDILAMSHGEVTRPETINYRTYKPERDGLFCERIFGPVKDYECACGKYKRIRYKGIVCDRCGVEVTEKKVRRERMGHIQLSVPVAHTWYFRSNPNKIGALLGFNTKQINNVVYYEKYVVINPGIMAKENINKLDFLSEEEYFNIVENIPIENQQLSDDNPDKFIAKMGGEALLYLLSELDLDELSYTLRDRASHETSQQRKSDLLKRLQVVEDFREAQTHIKNRPEWMILKILPVIPPDLRPLVPLDGGRFASSDLNELYRRVIIRNNRLKRLVDIKAPDVILRNEKRMLQEAVDSLFDNTRKVAVTGSSLNRPLKSLSDSLKGKQGRFRQNLLGKRVDYSGRSVIVVGPELKMNEVGLPKEMAAELFKPFIIRHLLERGIVKTVKSAKKIIERKDQVIWEILENVLKGHPVLLNRAPTLHRLSIQAFQPKMIEGRAIQLHPLVCAAFNADFDGDQMAVHVPLGNEAVAEAQILMLATHNILNPANGAPIAVPSQDMVLGLYYLTKERKSTPEHIVHGEGKIFYSKEEALLAYNEGKVDMHAGVKVLINDKNGNPSLIETTIGRIIFNEIVPEELGFINKVITKSIIRDIIADVLKATNNVVTTQFLDDVKHLGYQIAFKGGLSFNLGDLIIPEEKVDIINEAKEEVDEIMANYNMGLITNNERYNQVIDTWTHANAKLTQILIKQIANDKQGFNPVYMMLDSGARGSKEQIRQLCGMRGLMAKPQKSATASSEIIENPIIANFKEGLSMLEYFISSHGARKGLADTALKTADAGYLTRRLVDVAQDVIVTEDDCGTLRGLVVSDLRNGDEIVESLYDRILGRVSLHDIQKPITGEIIVHEGEEITEDKAQAIIDAGITEVEIRSVLTCESRHGVCAKCYGRNLAIGKLVNMGEAVGVIAAQSIGEPGTQLTLRTFHIGGAVGNVGIESKIIAKNDGIVHFDELRYLEYDNNANNNYYIVMGRSAEVHLLDPNTMTIMQSSNVPFGSKLYKLEGELVKKGEIICEWDAYNSLIVSEVAGKVVYNDVIENVTFKYEIDENTGHKDRIIIDSKQRGKIPQILITSAVGDVLKVYDLPVGANILVDDGQLIKAGDNIAKIPRVVGKASDITGGLPRVQELFEARSPIDPAVVAEIDGIVSFGSKLKKGNKEVIITSKTGEERHYLIAITKQILAQEGDFVKAGTPLSDGPISPLDILAIKGPTKVQEYLVNEIQEVYRLQGVKINDKHFEVIVKQMMQKVEIVDPGDTRFLEGELIDRFIFNDENDKVFSMKVVTDPGDSDLRPGMLVTARQLRDINSVLKRRDMNLVQARDAQPATAKQVLQSITRAALQTQSVLSAASFQETVKVLTNASVKATKDNLQGLKENVIVGHLIPAGTGIRQYDNLIVGSMDEYEALIESKKELQNQ
ncbi:MAG: DNA-directed RNA polymerase subunit beta' [Bacteroidales bacterium]|nr:DNA-directed RNA polymerase subunit beta' [Bacteroidales bacterium]